jgi:hypothetical protein
MEAGPTMALLFLCMFQFVIVVHQIYHEQRLVGGRWRFTLWNHLGNFAEGNSVCNFLNCSPVPVPDLGRTSCGNKDI